jgi:hypothetical protein
LRLATVRQHAAMRPDQADPEFPEDSLAPGGV